ALAIEERTEHDATAAIDAEVAAQRTRLGAQTVERERAHHARNESEVTLARGRERSRAAERAAQEAGFAERSCRERIAELARRREAIAAQVAQQEALLAQLATERQQIDWTPVEQSLQAQLVTRGGAEQALAAERDRRGKTQGTGGRVVRSAIRRATRRCACRARGVARAAQGLGPSERLAGRDRAPDAGDRRSGRRQSRRARRARPG